MPSSFDDAPRLISLVGLPAVGKTTIGRRLAATLRRPFHDTDRLVEEMAGRSIARIFEQEGEMRFRELEADALDQLGRSDAPIVAATGGGIVTLMRSREFLTDRAFAIYLRAPASRLVERLGRSTRRPLFRSGDVCAKLADLHTQRDPLYRAVARISVDVDAGTASAVAEIMRRLPRGPLDTSARCVATDGR